MKQVLSGIALALGAVGMSSASELTTEDAFFSDLPVVASVSRLPQRLSEAPGAVTVIDREMIKASGARNFSDLLRLVPGFQVTPPNQEGAIVAYHGLSNEEYTPRVQVLIDGRSQYSPLFKAGVNWNLLPVILENIDRIEVMRGSNAVTYGSNALLGVINIITLDPSQTRGWLVSANHGNNSIRDQLLRWGGRAGQADLRLSYKQYGDGGFQKMFDGGLGWFDPHDSRHGRVFDFRGELALSTRDELGFSLSFAEDISQFGRPRSTSDPMRDLNQHSTSAGLEWRRVLGDSSDLRLRYTHVEDWSAAGYRERVSFDTPSGSPVSFINLNNAGGTSRVDELEFQHRFSPSAVTRMIWGLGAKWVGLYAPGQFSTSDWFYRQNYRAFGNLEWRISEQWLANLGSSLEHDSVAGTYLDPRASVSYHITPSNTLRIIASRAHRSPSLYEAYGDVRKFPIGGSTPVDRTYLGVSGLKPERVDTLELGYLGEWKSLRASLDIRFFHERIPNRIQITPYALPASAADDRDVMTDRLSTTLNNTAYPYGRADGAFNNEKVVIQGYEYQVRWQPFESTRLLYNHAYIRTYANLIDESIIADARNLNTTKISRQTTESAPRNSQSAMIIQRFPFDIEGSVMYYKSGWMRWLRNSYTSPYERIDWRVAKRFKLGGYKAELSYTAQMANHDMEGRRNTRVAKELHWFGLSLEF
ncbi:MAG: TonB-dependent receptor [Dechloromonas sp.]|nr:MAG: TonB-dependent receptor [Dechloromonas sp.]